MDYKNLTKNELLEKLEEKDKQIDVLVNSNSQSQRKLTEANDAIEILKRQPQELENLKGRIKHLEKEIEIKNTQLEQTKNIQTLLQLREAQLHKLVELCNGLFEDEKAKLRLEAKFLSLQNSEFENLIAKFNEEIKGVELNG